MAKQSAIRTLSAGSIGNFGEIYDFAVFGFSVPILSIHFFPGTDRTAALLSTFAVYAVAFFARPLGGLMFGVMADKVGRVRVMAMTVWLMALGTAVIGLLPTYASYWHWSSYIAGPMPNCPGSCTRWRDDGHHKLHLRVGAG